MRTDQQSTAAVQQMKELTRRLIDRAYGRRESVSIDGQVTDEAGHAIRGATVGFGPYGLLPFQWNCETDDAGGFRLGFECGYLVPDNIGAARTRFRALGIPLPSQNLYTDGPTAVPADSLVVGAKGYAATRLPFARPPGSYSVAVRLRKGLTVRARVVDVEGRPIREAFAVFIARTPDLPKWIVQYRTDSDAEGRIEWSGACTPEVAIYAGKPKYRDGVGYHSLVTTARAVGQEQIIKLERMAKEILGIRTQPSTMFAYYVEPSEARDKQFPLFSPFFAVAPLRPDRYDRGYFGCCFGGLLMSVERHPRTLFDEKAENPASRRSWERPCPEVRRAPAPFEGKDPPETSSPLITKEQQHTAEQPKAPGEKQGVPTNKGEEKR